MTKDYHFPRFRPGFSLGIVKLIAVAERSWCRQMVPVSVPCKVTMLSTVKTRSRVGRILVMALKGIDAPGVTNRNAQSGLVTY